MEISACVFDSQQILFRNTFECLKYAELVKSIFLGKVRYLILDACSDKGESSDKIQAFFCPCKLTSFACYEPPPEC